MLPRERRLRERADFQRVYRGGRSWVCPALALHVLPRPDGQRVGFSVSKKIGKAVVRNRLRRRLREIVRARIDAWKPGFDAVLVARGAAGEARFEELERALDELARRARLLREPDLPSDAPYTVPASRRPEAHR